LIGDELFIGTIGSGIVRYNLTTQKVSTMNRTTGLVSQNITALLFAHNFLWIGTADAGLIRYYFVN